MIYDFDAAKFITNSVIAVAKSEVSRLIEEGNEECEEYINGLVGHMEARVKNLTNSRDVINREGTLVFEYREMLLHALHKNRGDDEVLAIAKKLEDLRDRSDKYFTIKLCNKYLMELHQILSLRRVR